MTGEEVIMAERNAVLRAALAELPASCQSLMDMLVSDPPYSHAAISTALLGLADIGGNRPGGDPGV
jgi:hypothetical protein